MLRKRKEKNNRSDVTGCISHRQAYDVLHKILSALQYRYANQFSVAFDDNNSVDYGETRTHPTQNIVCSVTIGCKEIDKNSNEPLPNDIFFNASVSIYHEQQHVKHIYDVFHNNDAFSRYLTLKYFADKNDDYYKNVHNYYNNPREIDCEFSGLMNAYVYAESIFGEAEAERLLCDYVNIRVQDGIYYLNKSKRHSGGQYCTTDEVFNAFEYVLADSVTRKRDCDYDKMILSEVDNPSAFYLHQHGLDNWGHIMQNCKNGYQQDVMCASAYLALNPYEKGCFASLENSDTDLTKVFRPVVSKPKFLVDFEMRKQVEGHIVSCMRNDKSPDYDFGD